MFSDIYFSGQTPLEQPHVTVTIKKVFTFVFLVSVELRAKTNETLEQKLLVVCDVMTKQRPA